MGILSGASDFFGLDIGTTAVRVVQLKKRGSEYVVMRFGKVAVDSQISNRTDDASLLKLAETVREALVQSQITTRNVVAGLPTNKIFSTIREFDVIAGRDFAKTLQFEIESSLPQSAQDSKVDWAILDPDIKDVPKKNVFIFSVSNEFIEKRLEMLERLNLNVLAFEPDALALVRAVASRSGGGILVVDVGFRSTDIVIVIRNQPRLITSIPVGLFSILKAVVNNLHLDQAPAQQMLFKIGLRGGQEYYNLNSAILQSTESLITTIKRTIDFFATRHPEHNLEGVMLWGDVVYVPGFIEFLTQKINLTVQIGDAWQNVVYPSQAQTDLQALSVNFAVVAGLAERQVV